MESPDSPLWNEKGQEMLSINEVAKLIGISPFTLRRWVKNGFGPAHIRLQRTIRFREQDVERWIEAHRQDPASADSSE